MRPGPAPILPALLPTLLLPTLLLLAAPAEARRQAAPPAGRPHHRAASDTDLPLARMLPPSARERVAAPPLTGWGYGGTVPDAAPGF